MCNCMTWCRVPTAENGKYPMSDHAPGCEAYKTERFVRLEHDGAACVMEAAEAKVMVKESECEYTVTPVFLTRDQFERMGEFHGF